MSLPVIAGTVLIVLALGYRFYGRLVARQYSLKTTQDTPAHQHNDGVDFVPTRPFYLFGQHFSAIAAAGPIVGPILACQQFGWLPALLWITVGVIFIGAVHDFTTLVASVRHGGKSIAEVVKANLGPRAWLAILAFIWLALIYVIVAFVDVTAGSFTTKAQPGITSTFDQGGAVALAGVLYLGLAVVMGLVERWFKPPLWLSTLIFVPLIFAAVWFGTTHSTWLAFGWKTWVIVILAYCVVASMSPMWLLLQPRGYLGGFVLYAALLIGTLGIFIGGFEIARPAFRGFDTGGPTGLLFPYLFVTIACGACSGFHGLVCSGTTSKQIDREQHCHPIGYGAMLLEAFVAVIALATIMIVAPSADGKLAPPDAVYASGIGRFLQALTGIDPVAATTFGAMVLSTFIFDTLDSATRLGRYILQELAGRRDRTSGLIATLLTAGVPLVFLLSAGKGSFRLFWTLFGTSNQLLAALSLLAITVWLRKLQKPVWYTVAPMVLVMAVTVIALVLQTKTLVDAAVGSALWINGLVSAVLLALAGTLVVFAVRAWRAPTLPRAVARLER
ncbi:MAG TPA: carbon starvation protein A [Kofleriaceae bacterium]|nr:carbon starvation protein A [Kofleriaceae bacterium]